MGEKMLKEGDKAPDFSLKGTDGKTYKLSDFEGKNVVLYFYPKDDTTGCTIEAKGFNEMLASFKKIDTEIIGVSKDSIESHQKFCNKYSLKFLLLSDPENKVIELYDAYGNKGAFGMGTIRKTYIIDKKGMIIKIFGRVHADGHNEEVMSVLKGA
jgi:thioredoxin-dependent peroxiredoxin